MLGATGVWFVIYFLSRYVYRYVEKPSIALGYRFWAMVAANKKPGLLPARVS
jgi:peptidoglycan/LPS O-acetylase OafA/YrhL